MKRISVSPAGGLLSAVMLLFLLTACSDEFEPIGPIDPDIPFAVEDLALTVSGDTVRITWTATGDDGPNGTATRYDLRRHGQPITDVNWDAATPVADVPRPREAGTAETFVMVIAPDEAAFFLGLKVVDDHGNRSELSNVVFLDRVAPDMVDDLVVLNATYGSVVLAWSGAPDDGPSGTATRYEIRATTGTIGEENWADLRPALEVNAAVGADGQEVTGLGGLVPETTYRAAVRARDATGNLSPISNIVEFTTRNEPVGWWDGFAGLGLNDAVGALLATTDTLYVGGRFSLGGSVGLSRIGTWDGTTWRPLGSGVSSGSFGTLITDLEVFAGQVFACGDFRIAGGQVASNFAAWTGSGWENPWGGPADFPPIVMEAWEGDLYLGGFFQGGNGSAFHLLTRFDGTTFHGMGWPEAGLGNPYSLLGRAGELVIGGAFEDRPIAGATSLVMWDGAGYTRPDSDLHDDAPLPLVVAMVEYQGDLIVAGDFTSAGSTALNGIARWDGVQWRPLASGMTGGENPGVSSVVVYRDFLVAAGTFTRAGGKPANNIALWDGYAWQALDSGLMGGGWVSGARLEVFQGSLYVGGRFDLAGGLESRNIARWDLD